MHAWPSSLRLRLALWYSALLAVPLIAFAFICYVVFAQALLQRTDHFIGDALTAFSRELVAERRAAATQDVAIRTTIEEVRFRDLEIAILDSTRRVVASTDAGGDKDVSDGSASSPKQREIVAAVAGLDAPASQSRTVSVGGASFRVVARPLVLRDRNYLLLGTYTLGDVDSVLARIRELFALAIPLLIVSAAIGGYFLAKRSLAPVAAMSARAADISATNLHERLPVGGGDELVGLARVVNDLLDRLEGSFERQRQFMADASHELRTPTAIIRTEADLTLSRPHRSEEEYRASVTVVQEATRRLTRIVEDLFLLARADAGNLVPHRELVYLEEIVHDATRGVRPVAERRGVRVALGHVVEAPFHGDADLLGRLLLNLLDNAIKHSSSGGAVNVHMAIEANHYVIAVIDDGEGIPPEAREQVFERFFRLDVTRSRSENTTTSGAGLGLAIARRIAEVHGGRLTLGESRPGRTEFRLALPAAVS
ncbi:MAG: ATP-binding protein [bacterium]